MAIFRTQWLKLYLIISFLWNSSLALIAYDCSGPSIHKTTISLVDTPSCTFERENVTEIEVAVAVTQSAVTQEIPFYRCLAVAYHDLWRCGSVLDTRARGSNYAEVITLSRRECEDMVTNLRYVTTSGNVATMNLSPSGRMSVSYTSWGIIDDSGSCKPGPLLIHGGNSYNKHTRNTRLELLYTKGVGRLAIERKALIMPNGMKCNIESESCELADYGQIFWRQPTPQCQSEVGEQSLVYKGPATLVTNHNSSDSFLHVSFSGHHFQIKVETRTTFICGFKSYYTEHPKLYVTLLDKSFPDFPLKQMVGTDVNMMNYINSKLVYSMRHIKGQVMSLYHLFEHERCLMQNRITSNLLTLAILSPREFAYQYFGEPGYTAVVRGEVVHIARCIPVPVVPHPLAQCYNELPVKHDNKTRFMTPRTRILTDIGTLVDCATELGTRFKIHDKWVTLAFGGLLSIQWPEIIAPDPLSYKFEEIEDMVTGGLYTKDTIERYQEILTSPIEESILTSRITSAIKGGEPIPKKYQAMNIFNGADIEDLRTKIQAKIYDVFSSLLIWGNWFSVIVMIGWVINAIVSVINCGFNYILIKPKKGAVIAFFTCCFSSLYSLLSSKSSVESSDKKGAIGDRNESPDHESVVVDLDLH